MKNIRFLLLFIGLFQFTSVFASSILDHAFLLQQLKTLTADEFEGREYDKPGSKKTQQYLIKQLTQLDIAPLGQQYQHNFSKKKLFSESHGSNIVALIPAKQPSTKYWVFSAHFDHIGKQGRKIFNGADDNASGVAALLTLGKQLKQQPLNVNVILLFTDGEEAGLYGAKAFVAQQPGLMKHTQLNINLDMLSGAKSTRCLHFYTKAITQAQLAVLRSNNEPLCLRKNFKMRGTNQSIARGTINWLNAGDHGAFYQANVPFIYFGVGMHKNYHTEHDTYKNTNKAFFVQATELIYQKILKLNAL